MKHVLIVLALVCMMAVPALGQVPYIDVYFDSNLTEEAGVCAGIGVGGTLYIALLNANAFVSSAEFRLVLPPHMTWTSESTSATVVNGTSTGDGVQLGFALPQNAFVPVLLMEVSFEWNCDDCGTGNPFGSNGAVQIVQHATSGETTPVYADWPTFTVLPAVGAAGLVCSILPTEESTWGGVKALYKR